MFSAEPELPLAEIDGLLDPARALARAGRSTAPGGQHGPTDPAEPTAPLRGRIAVIRSALASMRGDIAQTVALCEEAFAALPPSSTYWRSIAALNLGFAHAIGGDMAAAAPMLAQAVELCRRRARPMPGAGRHDQPGEGLLEPGAVTTGRRSVHAGPALLAQQGGWLRPYSVTIHVGLALVLYEWNDLDGAAAQVQQGLEHAELPSKPRRSWRGISFWPASTRRTAIRSARRRRWQAARRRCLPPACPGPGGW